MVYFRFFVLLLYAILRPILRHIFTPYLYICRFFCFKRFKRFFSASFLIFSVLIHLVLLCRKMAVSLQHKPIKTYQNESSSFYNDFRR